MTDYDILKKNFENSLKDIDLTFNIKDNIIEYINKDVQNMWIGWKSAHIFMGVIND